MTKPVLSSKLPETKEVIVIYVSKKQKRISNQLLFLVLVLLVILLIEVTLF